MALIRLKHTVMGRNRSNVIDPESGLYFEVGKGRYTKVPASLAKKLADEELDNYDIQYEAEDGMLELLKAKNLNIPDALKNLTNGISKPESPPALRIVPKFQPKFE